MISKPINNYQINNQNDNKRNSIFSSNSADFMKTVNNNDDDSWPETVSNTSINDKKLNLNYNHLSVNNNNKKINDDNNSFNSFKMNTNIKSDSSSTSDNNLKKKENIDQSNNQNQSLIKLKTKEEEQNPNSTTNKQVLHPENDEFIKQMKFLIEEEIQLNEELDEMLIIKQPEIETIKKDNKQLTNHNVNYLSEDDDWDDENDTLIKKTNINQLNNEKQIHNIRQQSLIYGLSDDEDDKKQISNNGKSKGKLKISF